MAELTKEQKENLERILELEKKRKPLPGQHIDNPDKFTMPVNMPKTKEGQANDPVRKK